MAVDDDSIRSALESAYDEAERYYHELDGENPRAAAILAASDFEVTLQNEIAAKFVRLNREIRDALFSGYGPLSTFAAKIDIGYALGLYGKQTRIALKSVKRIRNNFAHADKPIDFSDTINLPYCMSLKPKRLSNPDDPRERYIRYLAEVRDHLEHARVANAVTGKFNIPPLP